MKFKLSRPVSAIIVGAGHRSLAYANYSLKQPDQLQIVGVVEPNKSRRKKTADTYNIPEYNCYKDVKQLMQKTNKPIADAAINGTMDKIHFSTSIPLLKAGYHLLLEKPITTNEDDLLKLLEISQKYNRKVMICHVLRYAPFYKEIRKRILEEDIGEIINIQTAEHVSYHHMSVGYIRGKWNNEEKCGSSILMAKCCHDLDIITWLKNNFRPTKVSSFGSLMQFKPENAPEGAGTRCLVDCEIEEDCLYSAKKIYLDHPDRWSFYVWSYIENIENPDIEDKRKSLENDNPHGRCVWHCDNNVVDHQSVNIEFEDGATATHTLVGGTAKSNRKIHILGTKGEIKGTTNEDKYYIRYPDPSPGHEYVEKEKTLDNVEGGHGGGDLGLIKDFVSLLKNEETSISTTHLKDSIYGHLIGFKADKSMKESRVFEIPVIEDI